MSYHMTLGCLLLAPGGDYELLLFILLIIKVFIANSKLLVITNNQYYYYHHHHHHHYPVPSVQVPHPGRSQYFFFGLGATNSGLPAQSPSKRRASTETSRCLAKGDFGS